MDLERPLTPSRGSSNVPGSPREGLGRRGVLVQQSDYTQGLYEDALRIAELAPLYLLQQFTLGMSGAPLLPVPESSKSPQLRRRIESPNTSLTSLAGITLLASDLVSQAASNECLVCEMSFYPAENTPSGATPVEAVRAAITGFEQARLSAPRPIHGGVLICLKAGKDVEMNGHAMVLLAAQFQQRGVIGVSVDASCDGTASPRLKSVLQSVSSSGVPLVVRAGSLPMGDRDSIVIAATSSAARLCNCLSVADRPQLLQGLAAAGSIIEVAVSQSVRFGEKGFVGVFRDHPLARLVRSGVRVAFSLSSGADPVSDLACAVGRCGLTWAEAREMLVTTGHSVALNCSPAASEEFRLRLSAILEPALERLDIRPDTPSGAPSGPGAADEGGAGAARDVPPLSDQVVLMPRGASPQGPEGLRSSSRSRSPTAQFQSHPQFQHPAAAVSRVLGALEAAGAGAGAGGGAGEALMQRGGGGAEGRPSAPPPPVLASPFARMQRQRSAEQLPREALAEGEVPWQPPPAVATAPPAGPSDSSGGSADGFLDDALRSAIEEHGSNDLVRLRQSLMGTFMQRLDTVLSAPSSMPFAMDVASARNRIIDRFVRRLDAKLDELRSQGGVGLAQPGRGGTAAQEQLPPQSHPQQQQQQQQPAAVPDADVGTRPPGGVGAFGSPVGQVGPSGSGRAGPARGGEARSLSPPVRAIVPPSPAVAAVAAASVAAATAAASALIAAAEAEAEAPLPKVASPPPPPPPAAAPAPTPAHSPAPTVSLAPAAPVATSGISSATAALRLSAMTAKNTQGAPAAGVNGAVKGSSQPAGPAPAAPAPAPAPAVPAATTAPAAPAAANPARPPARPMSPILASARTASPATASSAATVPSPSTSPTPGAAAAAGVAAERPVSSAGGLGRVRPRSATGAVALGPEAEALAAAAAAKRLAVQQQMLLEKELIAERRRQDARRAGTPPPIPTQPNVPAFVPGGATNKPPIDPGDFYEMSTVDFFLAAMMRNWPSIASGLGMASCMSPHAILAVSDGSPRAFIQDGDDEDEAAPNGGAAPAAAAASLAQGDADKRAAAASPAKSRGASPTHPSRTPSPPAAASLERPQSGGSKSPSPPPGITVEQLQAAARASAAAAAAARVVDEGEVEHKVKREQEEEDSFQAFLASCNGPMCDGAPATTDDADGPAPPPLTAEALVALRTKGPQFSGTGVMYQMD